MVRREHPQGVTKVSIITRHAVTNYGSFLQTYATQKLFSQIGCDAKILNYINKNERAFYVARSIASDNHEKYSVPKSTLLYLSRTLKHMVWSTWFTIQRKRLLKMSRLYTSQVQLTKRLPQADIFCSGGDQVWNTIFNNELDPCYFLSFVPDNIPKISFGSSFGRENFPSKLEQEMQLLLKRYDHVSVRENRGLSILDGMGIHGSFVLDPVLMLEEKEWKQFAKMPTKGTPYVLIYQMRSNPQFEKHLMAIEENSRCKVFRITTNSRQWFCQGQKKYLLSPESFVGYFLQADFIITDSFHGMALSINCSKPFAAILPDRYEGRNKDLLEMFGLTNRIVGKDIRTIMNASIKWDEIQKKLAVLRGQSYRWLEKAIQFDQNNIPTNR